MGGSNSQVHSNPRLLIEPASRHHQPVKLDEFKPISNKKQKLDLLWTKQNCCRCTLEIQENVEIFLLEKQMMDAQPVLLCKPCKNYCGYFLQPEDIVAHYRSLPDDSISVLNELLASISSDSRRGMIAAVNTIDDNAWSQSRRILKQLRQIADGRGVDDNVYWYEAEGNILMDCCLALMLYVACPSADDDAVRVGLASCGGYLGRCWHVLAHLVALASTTDQADFCRCLQLSYIATQRGACVDEYLVAPDVRLLFRSTNGLDGEFEVLSHALVLSRFPFFATQLIGSWINVQYSNTNAMLTLQLDLADLSADFAASPSLVESAIRTLLQSCYAGVCDVLVDVSEGSSQCVGWVGCVESICLAWQLAFLVCDDDRASARMVLEKTIVCQCLCSKTVLQLLEWCDDCSSNGYGLPAVVQSNARLYVRQNVASLAMTVPCNSAYGLQAVTFEQMKEALACDDLQCDDEMTLLQVVMAWGMLQTHNALVASQLNASGLEILQSHKSCESDCADMSFGCGAGTSPHTICRVPSFSNIPGAPNYRYSLNQEAAGSSSDLSELLLLVRFATIPRCAPWIDAVLSESSYSPLGVGNGSPGNRTAASTAPEVLAAFECAKVFWSHNPACRAGVCSVEQLMRQFLLSVPVHRLQERHDAVIAKHNFPILVWNYSRFRPRATASHKYYLQQVMGEVVAARAEQDWASENRLLVILGAIHPIRKLIDNRPI